MDTVDIPTALEELHFPIKFLGYFANAEDTFARQSFKAGQLPTAVEAPLSAHDKAWIVEKGQNPNSPAPPPSLAAERALQRHLAAYNFVVPGTQDQWQSYIMSKYFELTLDPDPKIAKPALDALAKTSIVGLMVEKQEISIVHKSTEELEKALRDAITRYAGKTIEGTASVV